MNCSLLFYPPRYRDHFWIRQEDVFFPVLFKMFPCIYFDRLIETVKVIKEAELSPVHAYHDFSDFAIDEEGALHNLTNLNFHTGKRLQTFSAQMWASYA